MRRRPAQVRSLSGVAAVALGYHHSCARKTDGSVYCWGSNNNGQLGDGTPGGPNPCGSVISNPLQCRATPAQVAGLSGVAKLGFGGLSCARKTDGSLWCWGANYWGGHGNGSFGGRNDPPTAVVVPGDGLCSGGERALGLTGDCTPVIGDGACDQMVESYTAGCTASCTTDADCMGVDVGRCVAGKCATCSPDCNAASVPPPAPVFGCSDQRCDVAAGETYLSCGGNNPACGTPVIPCSPACAFPTVCNATSQCITP